MTTKRAGSATPRQDPRTGKWYFVVDGGTDPKTGRRQQVRRRGFARKDEAQEALDKVRSQRRESSYVRPATVTVKDYLAEWLSGLDHQVRASTLDGYRRNCDYVTDALGDKRLDRLTTADLNALYASLLKDGRRRWDGGLSKRSVRYIHTVLRRALADAVDDGTLSRNVADKAKPPRARDTRPPEQAFWTPAELRTFLTIAAHETLGPLFHVAAMTGMRRGEVCGLRWRDVDLDEAVVQVRQQLLVVRSPGAAHGGLRFSERTKSDHGRRDVDVDAGTVAVLRSVRARQGQERWAMDEGWQGQWEGTDHDLVFTQPDGRPVDPESVSNVFMRRVAASSLPRIRFHDLRHSHVAHLIEAGVPILAISKRLGHASVAFTLDRYGHLMKDAGSRAASAVAAVLAAADVTA